MNYVSRLSLLFVVFTIKHHLTVQITHGKNISNITQIYERNKTIFDIKDGEKLSLPDDFCLRSITVTAYLTNDTFVGEYKPSKRLNIQWESNKDMASLEVRSNSVNDPYCEAHGRFSYHRKPNKKNMHTFPDIVNYGPRYVPIQLDCKYIIIPEMVFPCLPVGLKYTMPVCLSETVCSCRNVSLPPPSLNIRYNSEGVTVQWEVLQQDNVVEIEKIFIALEPAQIDLPYNAAEIKTKEYSTSTWDNTMAKSGKHFFALNSNHSKKYMIKAFYETIYECSGNTTHFFFNFPEIMHENNKFLISIAYFFVTTILALMVLYCYWRKLGTLIRTKLLLTRRRTTQGTNNEDVLPSQGFQGLACANNPLYRCNLEDKDEYIIDYRQLIFQKKLAEGNFGIVFLALSAADLKGSKVFAVKQLKETATSVDVDDFLQEMNILKKAGVHRHIVRMIGYCKTPQPLSIVMEYVPYNLLEYLKRLRNEYELTMFMRKDKCRGDRKVRDSQETLPPNYISSDDVEKMPLNNEEGEELKCALNNEELDSFSLQIARGMAHLETKSIVHRDLAARNVLIDSFKTLKISDFGMSRTGIYVHRTNRLFPLRWMSPEAVTNGTFSNKSDVWSYGVVLWEIGTLGGLPYSDIHNDEVFSWIKKGGHPDQPEYVTPQLYEIMLSCWSYKPEDRPNFSDIVQKIETLRQKTYVDFGNVKDYYVFPPTEDEYHKCCQ